ncbi:hypothetical protein EYF80_024234 [Liparis tanakae]|uniref:Uncharacterized protein n=1 Tax=Liparis tanakae TaxID=230148 RepID=A0A4Z2HID5_9TELE|nr:hypothetical protein EYF80_024234 [Liparis tanakae]
MWKEEYDVHFDFLLQILVSPGTLRMKPASIRLYIGNLVVIHAAMMLPRDKVEEFARPASSRRRVYVLP